MSNFTRCLSIHSLRFVFAALALAAGVASAAETAPWKLGAKLSFDRNEGRYGQADLSRDKSTTLTLGLDTEQYAFDLLLPYVVQTGPGRRIVLGGRRAVVLIEPDRTSQGKGDVTLGVTRYLFNEESHGIDLDLGATYKFATASATKGLGSGKDDISVQVALGKSVGPLALNMTGGYTVVGKPDGQDYRNSGFASVDASVRPWRPLTLGVTLSYGGASAAGVATTREVTLYAAYSFDKQTRLELHALEGHSTQSPDRGWGATFSKDF